MGDEEIKNQPNKSDTEKEMKTSVNTAKQEQNENTVPDTVEELEELVLEQQEKIAELETQLEETRDTQLRKAAEMDNIKKRVQRDRAQMVEKAKIEALEAFLPINDDLQRTVKALNESIEKGKDQTGIEDGIRMIASKFEEALKRFDVVRIDETGVPFDVDLHDALMRKEPEDEDIDSDVVLQVLENGYRMGNRTIRHAKVIVSQ
ncbi:MAG: nucleotide exchange factor GrpE [Balneolaceae bacterium]